MHLIPSSILSIFLLTCASQKLRRQFQTEPPTHSKTIKGLSLHAPNKAATNLAAVTLEAGLYGNNLFLPTLRINLDRATFVQILRCQENYRKIAESAVARQNQQEMRGRWFWINSFGDQTFCEIATLQFQATTFQDLAAPAGKFFYLVNPCVAAAQSSTAAGGCSYNLVLSDSVLLSEPLTDSFREKAAQLAEVESQYDSTTDRLLNLGRQLHSQQSACIENHQNQETASRSKSQLTLLASIIVGAATAHLTVNELRGQGAKETTINTVAAGIFGIATSSSQLLATALNGSSKANLACEQAETSAESILKIHSSKQLENLQEKLISLSTELHQLESNFEGYNARLFANPPNP